jgi:hypothetical protein
VCGAWGERKNKGKERKKNRKNPARPKMIYDFE